MSAGLKANNDGSGAIQVGGTDYITISSAGAVAIPVSLTIAGQPAGGDYVMNAYVAPTTWSKPVGLKAIKVTVVGGGGTGGNTPAPSPASNSGYAGGGGGGGGAILYLDAPAIPGPVAVTAGPGTNSFGAFASATGGSNGVNGTQPAVTGTGGAGGTGTAPAPTPNGSITFTGTSGLPGTGAIRSVGGSSQLFYGQTLIEAGPTAPGTPNSLYGGGGTGAGINTGGSPTKTGGTGGPGIVIIEEFY